MVRHKQGKTRSPITAYSDEIQRESFEDRVNWRATLVVAQLIVSPGVPRIASGLASTPLPCFEASETSQGFTNR